MRLLPAFVAGLGGNIDEHAEALLRLGLFRTTEFHVPVGSLSAGQQRRLALARLLLGGFRTMLVDEPTNHLAPVLVEQLEAALSEFGGTLIMVSHDRALGEWFSKCAARCTAGSAPAARAGSGTGCGRRAGLVSGILSRLGQPRGKRSGSSPKNGEICVKGSLRPACRAETTAEQDGRESVIPTLK